MKILSRFILGSLLLNLPILAQGSFQFLNYGPGLDAPVYDVDCQTRLAGDVYLAQAYAGLTPDQLKPVGTASPFLQGPDAGYVGVTVVDVPGMTEPAQIVYFQMRAWESAAGPSFNEALAAGGKYGVSNISTVEARVGLGVPEIPVGLESFCLVPEPGTLTLSFLGLAGLALARRRPRAN